MIRKLSIQWASGKPDETYEVGVDGVTEINPITRDCVHINTNKGGYLSINLDMIEKAWVELADDE